MNNNLTYNEKKFLYEKIMWDVAKVAKSSLNEAYKSNISREIILRAKECSGKHSGVYTLSITVGSITHNYSFILGEQVDPNHGIILGELTDDCYDGQIVSGKENLERFYQEIIERENNHEPRGYIVFSDSFNIIDAEFAIHLSKKGIELLKTIEKKVKNREDYHSDERWKNSQRYKDEKRVSMLSDKYGLNYFTIEHIDGLIEGLVLTLKRNEEDMSSNEIRGILRSAVWNAIKKIIKK